MLQKSCAHMIWWEKPIQNSSNPRVASKKAGVSCHAVPRFFFVVHLGARKRRVSSCGDRWLTFPCSSLRYGALSSWYCKCPTLIFNCWLILVEWNHLFTKQFGAVYSPLFFSNLESLFRWHSHQLSSANKNWRGIDTQTIRPFPCSILWYVVNNQ